MFYRDSGGVDNWGQAGKLTASDAEANDSFGQSVAINGATAVVGAIGEDSAASGAGAAYVFRRDAGGIPDSWGEVAKLTASDGGLGDNLGESVSISAHTALIGAEYADYLGGTDVGSAYLYYRNANDVPDSWGEVAMLAASDFTAGDHFGRSVSIDGETILVGSPGDDDQGNAAGAAYVFYYDTTIFTDGFETGNTSEWSRTEP